MSNQSGKDCSTCKRNSNSRPRLTTAKAPEARKAPLPRSLKSAVENGGFTSEAAAPNSDVIEVSSSDDDEWMDHLDSSYEDDLPDCSYLTPKKPSTQATKGNKGSVTKTTSHKALSASVTKHSVTKTLIRSTADKLSSSDSGSVVHEKSTVVVRTTGTPSKRPKLSNASTKAGASSASTKSTPGKAADKKSSAKTNASGNGSKGSPSVRGSGELKSKVGSTKQRQSLSDRVSLSSGGNTNKKRAKSNVVGSTLAAKWGKGTVKTPLIGSHSSASTPAAAKIRRPKGAGTARKEGPSPSSLRKVTEAAASTKAQGKSSSVVSKVKTTTASAVKEGTPHTAESSVKKTQPGLKASSASVECNKQDKVNRPISKAPGAASTAATCSRTSPVKMKSSVEGRRILEAASHSSAGGSKTASLLSSATNRRIKHPSSVSTCSRSSESTVEGSDAPVLGSGSEQAKLSGGLSHPLSPLSNHARTDERQHVEAAMESSPMSTPSPRDVGGNVTAGCCPPTNRTPLPSSCAQPGTSQHDKGERTQSMDREDSGLSSSRKHAVEGPSGEPSQSSVKEPHRDGMVSLCVSTMSTPKPKHIYARRDSPLNYKREYTAIEEINAKLKAAMNKSSGKRCAPASKVSENSGNKWAKTEASASPVLSAVPITTRTSSFAAVSTSRMEMSSPISLDTETESSSVISVPSDCDMQSGFEMLTTSSQSSWDTESISSTVSYSSAMSSDACSKPSRKRRGGRGGCSVRGTRHQYARKSTGGLWKRRYRAPLRVKGVLNMNSRMNLALKPIDLKLYKVTYVGCLQNAFRENEVLRNRTRGDDMPMNWTRDNEDVGDKGKGMSRTAESEAVTSGARDSEREKVRTEDPEKDMNRTKDDAMDTMSGDQMDVVPVAKVARAPKQLSLSKKHRTPKKESMVPQQPAKSAPVFQKLSPEVFLGPPERHGASKPSGSGPTRPSVSQKPSTDVSFEAPDPPKPSGSGLTRKRDRVSCGSSSSATSLLSSPPPTKKSKATPNPILPSAGHPIILEDVSSCARTVPWKQLLATEKRPITSSSPSPGPCSPSSNEFRLRLESSSECSEETAVVTPVVKVGSADKLAMPTAKKDETSKEACDIPDKQKQPSSPPEPKVRTSTLTPQKGTLTQQKEPPSLPPNETGASGVPTKLKETLSVPNQKETSSLCKQKEASGVPSVQKAATSILSKSPITTTTSSATPVSVPTALNVTTISTTSVVTKLPTVQEKGSKHLLPSPALPPSASLDERTKVTKTPSTPQISSPASNTKTKAVSKLPLLQDTKAATLTQLLDTPMVKGTKDIVSTSTPQVSSHAVNAKAHKMRVSSKPVPLILQHSRASLLNMESSSSIPSPPLPHSQVDMAAGDRSSGQLSGLLSPQEEEYNLRLQETIAKLGGAETSVPLSSPRAGADPPPMMVSIPVSKVNKVLRLPPPPSKRQRTSQARSTLAIQSAGTFMSRGVQADSGLVIDRNVLDSFLTVKVNEALLGLKEQLRETERQVKLITEDKARLEEALREKVKLIQELTQTGFKPKHPEDTSAATKTLAETADTRSREPAVHVPISEKSQPSKVGRGKEKELGRSKEKELGRGKEKDTEVDVEGPGSWLRHSVRGTCSRCVPINLRPVTKRAVSDVVGGPPVNWCLLNSDVQGCFRNIYASFSYIKKLRSEAVIGEKAGKVANALECLLSHIAIPLTEMNSWQLSARELPGLPFYQLVSKLQQLERVLRNVRLLDTESSLPAYVKAEIVWTQQMVIDVLHWLLTVIVPANSKLKRCSKQSPMLPPSASAMSSAARTSVGGAAGSLVAGTKSSILDPPVPTRCRSRGSGAVAISSAGAPIEASAGVGSLTTTIPSSPSSSSGLSELQLINLLQTESGSLSPITSANQMVVLKHVSQLFQKKIREVIVSMVKKNMVVPPNLLALLAMSSRIPQTDPPITTSGQTVSSSTPVSQQSTRRNVLLLPKTVAQQVLSMEVQSTAPSRTSQPTTQMTPPCRDSHETSTNAAEPPSVPQTGPKSPADGISTSSKEALTTSAPTTPVSSLLGTVCTKSATPKQFSEQSSLINAPSVVTSASGVVSVTAPSRSVSRVSQDLQSFLHFHQAQHESQVNPFPNTWPVSPTPISPTPYQPYPLPVMTYHPNMLGPYPLVSPPAGKVVVTPLPQLTNTVRTSSAVPSSRAIPSSCTSSRSTSSAGGRSQRSSRSDQDELVEYVTSAFEKAFPRSTGSSSSSGTSRSGSAGSQVSSTPVTTPTPVAITASLSRATSCEKVSLPASTPGDRLVSLTSEIREYSSPLSSTVPCTINVCTSPAVSSKVAPSLTTLATTETTPTSAKDKLKSGNVDVSISASISRDTSTLASMCTTPPSSASSSSHALASPTSVQPDSAPSTSCPVSAGPGTSKGSPSSSRVSVSVASPASSTSLVTGIPAALPNTCSTDSPTSAVATLASSDTPRVVASLPSTSLLPLSTSAPSLTASTWSVDTPTTATGTLAPPTSSLAPPTSTLPTARSTIPPTSVLSPTAPTSSQTIPTAQATPTSLLTTPTSPATLTSLQTTPTSHATPTSLQTTLTHTTPTSLATPTSQATPQQASLTLLASCMSTSSQSLMSSPPKTTPSLWPPYSLTSLQRKSLPTAAPKAQRTAPPVMLGTLTGPHPSLPVGNSGSLQTQSLAWIQDLASALSSQKGALCTAVPGEPPAMVRPQTMAVSNIPSGSSCASPSSVTTPALMRSLMVSQVTPNVSATPIASSGVRPQPSVASDCTPIQALPISLPARPSTPGTVAQPSIVPALALLTTTSDLTPIVPPSLPHIVPLSSPCAMQPSGLRNPASNLTAPVAHGLPVSLSAPPAIHPQHSLPIPRIQVTAQDKGIIIKWTLPEEHLHKQHYIETYELFAWVSNSVTAERPPISTWAKVGQISPLSLPMQVTLTNFARGQAYSFSVRAVFRGSTLSTHSQPKTLEL